MSMIEPIKFEDGKLIILDQRKLPFEEVYLEINTIDKVYEAIADMAVRGAPAIGVTAAYGMVISALECKSDCCEDILARMKKDGDFLKKARPTAVNLSWAIDRMNQRAAILKAKDPILFKWDILAEAIKIHEEDASANRMIGENALVVLGGKRKILTHCNAGILATTSYGTATAVFYVGKERGIEFKVFADETRPRLQGARLTAYELFQNGIDVTVISDTAAAHLMSTGEIEAVITGCDRVAANGDTANKIGTLSVAIAAAYHNIPMYIACPLSTVDYSISSGKDIVIEERDSSEVEIICDKRVLPEGIKVRNPAFDVTPAELITAIITEKGVVYPPYENNLRILE
ncbi:MAG TPA: S-methyl-5-thioribose-1-phosphate isomerase [Clostridia bacterium]|nr:S-methyl-5-thioribose-1-phosphate isomerase [Clostridia bacterium]